MSTRFFVAPSGLSKTVPRKKKSEYLALFNRLGSFHKHQYDLDICVLYRQMEEMRGKVKKVNGIKFSDYLKQIRDLVSNDMTKAGLNADFYLDHFFYVLTPADQLYDVYLGLFFSLSNPLMTEPLLQYHMNLAIKTRNETPEDFFSGMEYSVCRYLRTNRFPEEDYFIKHDKIFSWLQRQRDFMQYRNELNNKFDHLVSILNKVLPDIKTKISLPDKTLKPKKPVVVRVKTEMVDVLLEDLKNYVSPEGHKALKKLFNGTMAGHENIIFKGQVNQLVDVFRIYCEDQLMMPPEKKIIMDWLIQHFYCLDESTGIPSPLSPTTVKNIMYRQDLPSKQSRIQLNRLLRERSLYYKK